MEILIYVGLAWWLVNFEPLQILLDAIFSRLPINGLTIPIHAAFGCPKCVGFWVSWALTGEFLTATIISLTAHTLDLCLQRLNK